MHLAFGANAPAVSTVLAVYMAGMALGAFAAARLPWLRRRPLKAYAVLEIGVALCALVLPFAITAIAPVHHWFTSDLQGDRSFVLILLIRAVLVGSLLLLPTAAMGATLPLLAEGFRGSSAVRQTGLFYAINLLGAVVGAAAVGFVLIPNLGVRASNYVAAALDVLAALLVLWTVHRFKLAKTAQAAVVAVQKAPPWSRRALLAVFSLGLSGLLAMQLQVLWSRALSVVIGSSTYAFSLILVVTLSGMALGGRIVTGRPAKGKLRRSLRRLAILYLIAALGILLGSQVVDLLPYVIRDAARIPDLTPTLLFAVEVVVVAAVVLVPATALGGALPCVLQVCQVEVRQGAGHFVGRAYAVNTVGAIVGSLLGGFVLIPYLGVDRGLLLSSSLYGLLAALVLFLVLRRPLRATPLVLKPVLVAVLAIAIAFAPGFDVMRWSTGFFRVSLTKADVEDDDGTLLYHADGIIATVTVEDNHGSVALKVNGKVDASSVGDMPTQILSGLLPLFFGTQPEQTVVIGFGSGVTAGALLQTPVKSLTLVELEEHVLEAGYLFSHVNDRPWEDPRVQIVVEDGRNFLEQSDNKYDLIVSEPSNPWMSGAASLFTKEFWDLARGRLQERGIFLQWVQLYELDQLRIRSLIRTFGESFEHVLMFSANPGSSDTLLIASPQPLQIDMERAHQLFAQPHLRQLLLRGELHEPAELVGLLLLGDHELRQFAAGAPLNTDDNAYVEFHAPLDLISYSRRDAELPGLKVILGNRDEMVERYFSGPLVQNANPCQQYLFVARSLVKQGFLEDGVEFLEQAITACPHTPLYAARIYRQKEVIELLLEPDSQTVVDPVSVKEGDLRYLQVLGQMIDGHDSTALTDLETVIDVDTAEPGWLLLFAYLCYREDRLNDARYLIKKLLRQPDYLSRMPEVYYYGARIAYADSDYRTAEKLARYFVEHKAVKRGRTDFINWDTAAESARDLLQ